MKTFLSGAGFCVFAAFTLFFGAGALAQAPKTSTPATSPTPTDYHIRWNVKIPLRDKVELGATLYLPGKAGTNNAALPVIFTLTPYIADSYHPRGAYFAAHGYAFVLVDTRGRGNSGGEFEPFAQEPHDGHDVVEWLAGQSFCNGKVAMWGGSYAGFDQWATAKEFPPHLATIVPVASAHLGADFPLQNNINSTYNAQWLTLTSGRTGQENAFGDQKFWIGQLLAAYQQHLPFKSLDSFVGNPSPNFQRWVQHPIVDAYYDAMVPTEEQYQKITLPILTITGQYDDDELGALTYYRNHLAHSTPEASARHFLIIGPWDHAGTRTPTEQVGGVKLGPASLLDLPDLHRQWYDWTLKDGPKPEFLKDQVAYYLLAPGNTGADGEWKYAKSLESLTTGSRPFYLASPNGTAGSVFESGNLTELPQKEGFDSFISDPLDIRRGEAVDGGDPNDETMYLDQRYALSIAGDGLVYHSEPLPNETPLVGCPALTLWLSLDTPDADLQAALYEIQPDGTSILLWSDLRRLRYRESVRVEKLLKPGEIVKCEFNPGLFVARRLMKGSRLRLIVSSLNSIWWQKNYNSGGVVAEETAKDARTAHVKVYHNAEHASTLHLPLR